MKDEIYERGLAIRKEVIGTAYVEKALADADEFSQPLQDLLTTIAGAPSGAARGWNTRHAVC